MATTETKAEKRMSGFRPYFSSRGAASQEAITSQPRPMAPQADRYVAGMIAEKFLEFGQSGQLAANDVVKSQHHGADGRPKRCRSGD